MEWNGDVCVRNKITTFAAPIYLLKFTISGVTEQRQSQWIQNDLNPRIFAKAGERQMKSPDVDNILEDRNKTQQILTPPKRSFQYSIPKERPDLNLRLNLRV